MSDSKAAATVQVIRSVYGVVVAAGPDGCPAGHLYAALMEHGCTLSQYEAIEGVMIRSGLVSKRGHLLFANPPKGGEG